jgi:hypothetical protein
VLVVTACALLVRLWFPAAWAEGDELASAFYLGDARAFSAFAAHIVAGEPFDNGVPYHPPGWAYVLAAFYAVCGFDPMGGTAASAAAVKAFVAVLSAAAAGLATLGAGRLGGRVVLYATGPLAVLHFGHIVEGTVPNSEALYGLMLTLVLLTGLSVMRGRAAPWPAAAAFGVGILAGATATVRAEFLLGALLLVPVLWRFLPEPRRGPRIAAYAVGLLVALAPSTVANWRSIEAFNVRNAARLPGPLPRFAPVTSYGAFNFAMANHELAEGGPNSDHPRLVAVTPEEEALLEAGQLDLSVASVHRLYVGGYVVGAQWMLTHPWQALSLVAAKTRIAAGGLALGYGITNVPVGVDGLRRRVDLLDPASRLLLPLHGALAVYGGAVLWRRRDGTAWLLAVPVLTLLASTWLFYGYVRLVVAYLPVLWPLQGIALASVLSAAVGRPQRVRRLMLGLLVAGTLLFLAGAQSARTVVLDGPRDPAGEVLVDETVRVGSGL